MRTFLSAAWRHVVRALTLSCLALAAPLPGVDYIVALSMLRSRGRKELPPGLGCVACDLPGRGCDAGRPHWILTQP